MKRSNTYGVPHYLYLAILKYRLKPTQIGMYPSTRKIIHNSLFNIYDDDTMFTKNLINFVNKYSAALCD